MDVEKTIEFILEQQTRFEAGMQALSASQQETDRRLRSTERLIRRLARLGAAQLETHVRGSRDPACLGEVVEAAVVAEDRA